MSDLLFNDTTQDSISDKLVKQAEGVGADAANCELWFPR